MAERDEQVQRYGSRGDKAAMTRWILWGALLFSHLVLIGLGAFLRLTMGEESEGMALEGQLVIAIAGLGALVPTLVGPRLFPRMDPTAFMLVRWSCVEALTIFGLVLAMMGARWEIIGALMAIGLLTHLWLRPDQ